jgi:protein involved in polysaccharide export with SLBB domain
MKRVFEVPNLVNVSKSVFDMKGLALIIGLILIPILSGCVPPVVKDPTPVSTVQSAYPSLEAEYRVQAGDQLEVKFYYNPELNEQVIVRPDGRISLQLVHEIMAAGLTPAELTRFLTEKYTSELKKPELTVIVRSFGGRGVYVDGEVNRPGIIPLIRPISVLQSISQAGGVKDTAQTNHVIVIRRDIDNKPGVIPVNIEKAIDGTDMKQDIFLMPLDIVYVPKSPIANVNVWVDQYIRRNIPIPFSLGYDISP